MDWFQAGVTVGGLIGAQLLRDAYFRGRSRTQVETIVKDVDDHKEWLERHDEALAALPGTFVTRTEITPQLEGLSKGQDRTNRLLDRMLLQRAGLPDHDGG